MNYTQMERKFFVSLHPIKRDEKNLFIPFKINEL